MNENRQSVGRYDLYHGVHKGLRYGHCKMLMALGTCNFSDDTAANRCVQELRHHLDICASHLLHEDEKIHTALERVRPGAAAIAEEGHEHHEQSFRELRDLVGQVESAGSDERQAIARKLYSRFALLVADDLAHMNDEETVLQPALWDAYDDAELIAIEQAIVGSIPPAEMAHFMALMIAAMNQPERSGMLSGIRAGMPAFVFNEMMERIVRNNVPPQDWPQLATLLADVGLPAA